jgi:hypothetical protein
LSSVNDVHGRRQLLEPLKLALGRLAHLLRKLAERVEAVAQLRRLRLLRVGLAELLLDRLQLLAQEVLALALFHLRLHLRLDLRAELEHLELAVQDRRDHPQARLDVHLLEDLLPLLGPDRAERRGDEVAEGARVVDVRGGELQLLREVRREADDAGEQPLHVPRQRLELRCLLEHVGQRAELAEEVRVDVEPVLDPPALEALHEDAQRPVGHLDHLVDDRDGADVVDVVEARRVERAVAGGDEGEHAVAGDDVVDQPHRALLADRERRHRLREDDGVLQRQHRQHRRQLELRLLRLEPQVAHSSIRSTVMR